MISVAILVRVYLVVGIIFGAAAYANVCAERREGWKLAGPTWVDLIAVFLTAITWLPAALLQSLQAIWREISQP